MLASASPAQRQVPQRPNAIGEERGNAVWQKLLLERGVILGKGGAEN